MAEDVTPGLDDAPQDGASQPGLSFWQRLRGGHNQNQRLVELEQAIIAYPDAPVNYILRGEVYLALGEYALAEIDFERGLRLAQAQYARDEWGIITQALQDRALRNLEKAIGKSLK